MPWQTFSFHIKLPPEGCEKYWWVDLVLMDKVVGKVIEEKGKEIVPWLFHRRALSAAEARRETLPTGKPQEPGHILNFQCRATREAAEEIHVFLEDCAFKALGLGQLLERVSPPIESEGELGNEDWPAPLQAVWPFFIHAVSEIVLQLVRQTRKEKGCDHGVTDLQQVERCYREIQEHLDDLWQQHGDRFVEDIREQALARCEPVRRELEGLAPQYDNIFRHQIKALLGYHPLLRTRQRPSQ